MSSDLIMQKLERIESLLEEQVLLKKEVLDFNDACQYLKLSSSHMYKLTSSQSIPHFRPNGKKLYFKRSELNDWLLRNRVDTIAEVEQQAADYRIRSNFKF